MHIIILESGIKTKAQREQHEDRWISQLQSLQPSGMNIELGAYGREMYASYAKTC